MKRCGAKHTYEIGEADHLETISLTCDKQMPHLGPTHHDSEADVSWIDVDLPEPSVDIEWPNPEEATEAETCRLPPRHL